MTQPTAPHTGLPAYFGARGVPFFPTRQTFAIRIVLFLFFSVQLADAAMTIAGVRRFGMNSEWNYIVWSSIQSYGPIAGVLLAKLLAMCFGFWMYVRGQHLLLALATILFIVFALTPWSVTFAFCDPVREVMCPYTF
ncbi:MAG TPA: hypothetical protein VNZ26_02850 [Vicinamibacterales bacterium]|nr:hypothetical protein [Vicinamibacterales bacterium]